MEHNCRKYKATIKLFKVKYQFIFRGLTRRDLRLAGLKDTTFLAERFILETCVEGDWDWENLPGFIVNNLLNQIYKISGIGSTTPWDEAANWLDSEDGRSEAVASAMIPYCTPEYLENCDPVNYAKTIYLGRFILKVTMGITPEQLFGVETSEEAIDHKVDSQLPTKAGEVGKEVEQFSWRAK